MADKTCVLGRDVLHWDEYRRLAGRLGIDLDAPTTEVVIHISIDQPVRVEHHFYGEDIISLEELEERRNNGR